MPLAKRKSKGPHQQKQARPARPPARRWQPLPADIIQDIYFKLPNFWIQNGSGQYEQLLRTDCVTILKRRIASLGISQLPRDEMADMLTEIAISQAVDFVLPCLPGYPVGLHQVNDTKILVPKALEIIKPLPGKCPLWDGILSSMLGKEQLEYLLGWLALGYRCLQNHKLMPGQVVILAGPQGCGKNLIQEQLFTPVFGGALADPYHYAVGRTPFNQELFRSMHLMISDAKKPSDRTDMQEAIRRIASNDHDALHPKHKEAISVPILWRMSVSCNEAETDLRIIPPLTGLEDKIMLFRCALAPMPMSTSTPDQYQAFGDALRAELPAFVTKLLAFKIPKTLVVGRWGIKGYLHSELIRLVRQLDPEEELLELIRAAKKASPQMMVLSDVTANEVHKALYEQNNLRAQLLTIARSPVKLGQLLGRLAERNDGTVTKGTINCGYQLWDINP